MKKVIVENIENFADFVNAMELNVRYMLPSNYRYEWIQIEEGREYSDSEIHYTWSMEYNYKMAKCVGYIFPSASKDRIKHFKTEKGAKRNFIKEYDWYFTPQILLNLKSK